MEPQRLLAELLDALEWGDDDTLDAAFKGLAAWLRDGGQSPIVETLGYGPAGRRRIVLSSCGDYSIQTVKLMPAPIFEFLVCDPESGDVVERYPLVSG